MVISRPLQLQWKCEQQAMLDPKTGTYTSQATECQDHDTQKSVGSNCDWQLTKTGPGTYRVQCVTGEDFLNGTIIVTGNTMTGKMVDRGADSTPGQDGLFVNTITIAGNRAAP